MNERQHNIVSKSRKNKIKEVTSIKIKQKSKRVKFSSFPKSIYIISCLKNLFLSLINKIKNFFNKLFICNTASYIFNSYFYYNDDISIYYSY